MELEQVKRELEKTLRHVSPPQSHYFSEEEKDAIVHDVKERADYLLKQAGLETTIKANVTFKDNDVVEIIYQYLQPVEYIDIAFDLNADD